MNSLNGDTYYRIEVRVSISINFSKFHKIKLKVPDKFSARLAGEFRQLLIPSSLKRIFFYCRHTMQSDFHNHHRY